MPLTVLSDNDVRVLLHSLNKKDILNIQQQLADALHYYSTATVDEDNGCCASYQPSRTQLTRKDGSTTLFMPASSTDGMGVKIVTLSEFCANSTNIGGLPDLQGRLGSISSTEDGSTLSSREGSVSSDPSLSSGLSSLSIKSSASTAATSTSSHTTPFDVPPDITAEMRKLKMQGKATSPTGTLTLLNKDGSMRGLINAAEITAFRTALASTMLFKKRANVHDVVIFGAGKQAYWHARLALLLRGTDVHHLNFINRSFENVTHLIHDLYQTPWPIPVAHPNTTILTPSHSEYARHLKSLLRASSVIFTTTPSLTPLFPHEILTSTEGRKKGRYLSAIGSYKPHMLELPVELVRQAVAPPHGHHHHRHARSGGAVIVDSVEACLREAGEMVQAGLKGEEVVELGELVMLKGEGERQRRGEVEVEAGGLDEAGVELLQERKGGKKGKTESGGKKSGKAEESDGGLKDWLERGNVIYKSVGLGLMDVVVGRELCELADRLGLGTRIAEF